MRAVVCLRCYQFAFAFRENLFVCYVTGPLKYRENDVQSLVIFAYESIQ